MKTEFTPGPWSVYDVGEFPGVDSDSGESIIVWGDNGDESGVRGMANAHLISAAPELYEALDNILQNTLSNQSERGQIAVMKARAALAKARGETK